MEVGVLASFPFICSEGIYLADYSEFGFLEGCPVLRAATLKKVTVLDVGGDVDWGLLL